MGQDTALARTWFDRAGIDAAKGVPHWVLSHVKELACEFADELAALPRIELSLQLDAEVAHDPSTIEMDGAAGSKEIVDHDWDECALAETSSEATQDEEADRLTAGLGSLAVDDAPAPPDDLEAVCIIEGTQGASESDPLEALEEPETGTPAVVVPTSVEQPRTSVATKRIELEHLVIDLPQPIPRIASTGVKSKPLWAVLPADLRFLALFADIALREATRLGLMSSTSRWSLAELQAWDGIGRFLYRHMQAASFEWPSLKEWSGDVAGYRINGYEAIGLAMLSHCAWVGRAQSNPGEIWPSVWESLGSTARETWFQHEGYVRANVRGAIRTACYRFGLRHAFDVGEGEQQAWLRTIQMQYGFSRNWEYLSEYHKPAIAGDLMDPDSDNYSPEFELLWDSVLKFQHRLITRSDLKRTLDGNPWLPADGVEGLIERAESRPAPPREPGCDTASGVFRDPEVHWQGNEPVGRVHLSDRLSDLLTGDEYTLHVGPRLMPIRRTSDGFRIIAGPEFRTGCDLELMHSRVSITIERQKEAVIGDEVSFEPENGLFSLYSAKNGKPLDLDRAANLTSGYTLLCRKELTVHPELVGCEWRQVFGGAWRMMQIPGSQPFEVYLEDEKLWPVAASEQSIHALPVSLRAVCDGGYWGEQSKITLRGLPDEVQPLRFLFAQQEFAISQNAAGAYVVERFSLEPGLLYGINQPRVESGHGRKDGKEHLSARGVARRFGAPSSIPTALGKRFDQGRTSVS